jgi:hypothetical protein
MSPRFDDEAHCSESECRGIVKGEREAVVAAAGIGYAFGKSKRAIAHRLS